MNTSLNCLNRSIGQVSNNLHIPFTRKHHHENDDDKHDELNDLVKLRDPNKFHSNLEVCTEDYA